MEDVQEAGRPGLKVKRIDDCDLPLHCVSLSLQPRTWAAAAVHPMWCARLWAVAVGCSWIALLLGQLYPSFAICGNVGTTEVMVYAQVCGGGGGGGGGGGDGPGSGSGAAAAAAAGVLFPLDAQRLGFRAAMQQCAHGQYCSRLGASLGFTRKGDTLRFPGSIFEPDAAPGKTCTVPGKMCTQFLECSRLFVGILAHSDQSFLRPLTRKPAFVHPRGG